MTNEDPFDDPLEAIFAEAAIRVQLPPSKYQLACDRYDAVSTHAERDGSQLKDKIARFYPQGSMAIGATIAARGKDEEYDIDIVAELLLPLGSCPKYVLDLLFNAIKGDEGSIYYEMVKRRTRCVTIYYADGMHLDITPVILREDRLERTSDLFHDDPDEPQEPAETLLMNAWGFSETFKANTVDTTGFAEAYARNTRALDLLAEAEIEEVDPQEDIARKSSDVVALQLIKRFRNTRYKDRNGRMPPSVLLSKYVSDASNPSQSLVYALGYHAAHIRKQLVTAEARGRLVDESNPACVEDSFTDRWPLTRTAQQEFISDLDELLAVLQQLKTGDVSMAEMQDLLVPIFGDFPVKAAVRAAQDRVGKASRSARTTHKPGGGILLGAAASVISRPARASTNMGGRLFK